MGWGQNLGAGCLSPPFPKMSGPTTCFDDQSNSLLWNAFTPGPAYDAAFQKMVASLRENEPGFPLWPAQAFQTIFIKSHGYLISNISSFPEHLCSGTGLQVISVADACTGMPFPKASVHSSLSLFLTPVSSPQNDLSRWPWYWTKRAHLPVHIKAQSNLNKSLRPGK